MWPRDVDIMRRTAVAGLISEQSECYASPPTAMIPILNHDSRAQECQSIIDYRVKDYLQTVISKTLFPHLLK